MNLPPELTCIRASRLPAFREQGPIRVKDTGLGAVGCTFGKDRRCCVCSGGGPAHVELLGHLEDWEPLRHERLHLLVALEPPVAGGGLGHLFTRRRRAESGVAGTAVAGLAAHRAWLPVRATRAVPHAAG